MGYEGYNSNAQIVPLVFGKRGAGVMGDGTILSYLGQDVGNDEASAIVAAGEIRKITAATDDTADEFTIECYERGDGATVLASLAVTPAAKPSGTTATTLGSPNTMVDGSELMARVVNPTPGDFTFGEITVTVYYRMQRP